jgi:hypothetical protein
MSAPYLCLSVRLPLNSLRWTRLHAHPSWAQLRSLGLPANDPGGLAVRTQIRMHEGAPLPPSEAGELYDAGIAYLAKGLAESWPPHVRAAQELLDRAEAAAAHGDIDDATAVRRGACSAGPPAPAAAALNFLFFYSRLIRAMLACWMIRTRKALHVDCCVQACLDVVTARYSRRESACGSASF